MSRSTNSVQQQSPCTETKCSCGHCYNLELQHLFREVHLRGYSTDMMEVVYRRAGEQLNRGDPEYTRFPALHTILRRVLRGDYDHLFLN